MLRTILLALCATTSAFPTGLAPVHLHARHSIAVSFDGTPWRGLPVRARDKSLWT